MELLLDYGAQIDTEDKHGRTPLAILSSMANATWGNGFPLFSSIGACLLHERRERELQIAKLLLDAQADPSAMVGRDSCIAMARANGNEPLVQLFLGRSDVPQVGLLVDTQSLSIASLHLRPMAAPVASFQIAAGA